MNTGSGFKQVLNICIITVYQGCIFSLCSIARSRWSKGTLFRHICMHMYIIGSLFQSLFRLLTEMFLFFCSGCSEGGIEEEEGKEKYELTAFHVSLPPHAPFEHYAAIPRGTPLIF